MSKKFLLVLLVALLLSTSCSSPDVPAPEITATPKAQELFSYKNPFIGDASANGQLLNALEISETFGPYGVQLQTDEEPYWLRLEFENLLTPSDALDLDREMFDHSLMLLALIDNVHEIQWSYPHMIDGKESLITVYMPMQQATDAVGEDIKSFGTSDVGVQKLMDYLHASP